MTTLPATQNNPEAAERARGRAPTNQLNRERIPPQDLDAEMALLGAMMMSRDAVGEVIPIIGREDNRWFYLPIHQRLFEVLIDLYDDPSRAIDLIVLSDELRRRELLEFIGGYDYMIQLAESFGDWANAEHYARIVRDKGMLRDLIRTTSEIAESAYAGVDEARYILDVAEQRIFAVTEQRVSGQVIAIKEAVGNLARQLEMREEGICSGLSTGFGPLDELLGGFQAGDLVIIAGRPSMGKTALGLTMALSAAMPDHGQIPVPVVFFSMEMSNAQLAQRLVCAHTGIDSQKVRRARYTEEEKYRLLSACAEFEQAPFFIDDTPSMTAMELRSKARRLKQKADIKAVFVDYMQLMHVPNSESRQVEIANISRNLKSLGRELGVPIIALSQLNRMPEGRQDKKPLMSDLRESGAIEQDADVVLLIHREEYYKPEDESVRGLAELIIAKQRNGPTGIVELHFNKKLTRFTARHRDPVSEYASENTADSGVPF